jgi:subtilisin family serine protease
MGHIETTTGASLVRALISGTTIGGNGIGIAVLDSGIEANHADFKPLITSRVVYNKSFLTGNTDTSDKYGHGTHVAGLVAGNDIFSNNYSGYYNGTAPSANLLNLRVLDDTGKGTASNVIAAIDWAIANKTTYNIRVLNLSLGTGPKDSYTTDPLCQAARRAVNAGIVVVASAGNYGKDALGNKTYGGIGSPGIEPSVITVGAVNTYGTDIRSDDTIATYSSRGPTRGYKTLTNGARKYDNLIKPDLVAPGNKLIAPESLGNGVPDPATGWIYYKNKLVTDYPSLRVTEYVNSGSGVNLKGYQYCSGTSMAAPVVSGAVALMLQVRPNLTPSLVKAILMYSAQPLPNYNTLEQGAGELNVDGAVRIAKLVKTTLPTANGSALLSAALPSSQTSVIAGQTVTWGKGVITNFGFLYGNDLMNKWQGMYGNGVLVSDGTPFASGVLTKSTTKTSGTLSLYQGAIKNNGVLVSDGTLYMGANAMGGSPTPVVNGQGVLVSDGVLISDGVLVSDGVLIGDGATNALTTWLGDNTASMLPAP